MDSIPFSLARAHFRTVFLIFVALTQLSGLVEAQSPPSSYDLRAVGSGNSTVAWVPAIQNQGAAEDCWTFASATAMNSNLLMNGLLPTSSVAPAIQISSWHLSAYNGSPDNLLAKDALSNNSNWGGWEFQALGYVTRGAGQWTIPNVPSGAAPQEYQTQMGGGPVLVSSNSNNPFPQSITEYTGHPDDFSPANLTSLLPTVVNQPTAYQVQSVVFYQQGFANNVALPTSTGTVTYQDSTYSTYSFTQGAADPQVAAVKAGIIQYGAVTTSMNADAAPAESTILFDAVPPAVGSNSTLNTINYFNPYSAPGLTGHEVTIIGWDDDYSMTDPNTNTTYTGAWLVQNSWGSNGPTEWQNWLNGDGTFWAPYNDAAIGRMGVAAFELGSNAAYGQTVIQNELGPMDYASNFEVVGGIGLPGLGIPTGMAVHDKNQVASILTPTESGLLAALGVVTQASGVTVEVDIYSDWADGPANLLSEESFSLTGIGYHQLDLATQISLTASDTVVVQLTYLDTATMTALENAVPVVIGGSGLNGYLDVPDGLSYYFDGSVWRDFSGLSFTSYSGSGPNADGGILFLKGVTAIPEPSTILLLGVAGLIVFWRLRVWRA
ncbi:MAG: lectin like domain-containing protein [Terrimicrobiaceae bacterium]